MPYKGHYVLFSYNIIIYPMAEFKLKKQMFHIVITLGILSLHYLSASIQRRKI